jgi:hypothetical protein
LPRLVRPLAIALLLCPSAAVGRTWHIAHDGSGDAPTIQAGIDSAAVGDTVLVGPGTYLEHPDFSGKDIVLKSSDGPGQTVLDGSLREQLWVVGFRNGESNAAILEGFTVTAGLLGIDLWNSEPTIEGNVIMANEGGGGIESNTDSRLLDPPWRPIVKDNRFEANSTSDNGGAICFFSKFVPTIINNVFLDNQTTFGDGGAIYIRMTDPGTVISGNRIEGNVAEDHGGGIYAAWILTSGKSELEISWNVIRNNTAHGRAADYEGGGGIWIKATDAWVHHNTLVGNWASDDDTGSGGGICLVNEVAPVIEQNIIAYSPRGHGMACIQSTASILNNLLWENWPPNDFDPVCQQLADGHGNVIADPRFCDLAGGDLSVAADSPAMTHPAGPLGAISAPGCGPTPVKATTWGAIKARYPR